jgi:NADH-ubiquinone oxidoreductase chain 5
MFISLISLIILSIISGYLFNDMFLGYGSLFWNNSIFLINKHFNFIDVEFVHPIIKNLPIILCILLIILFNFIFITLNFNSFLKSNIIFYKIYNIISYSFYYSLFFDKIYNEIYKKILNLTYLISTKYIDKGLLELFGPWGIYKFFKFLNKKISNFIQPLIFYYLFIFFFFLALILIGIIIVYIFKFNIFTEHLGLILIINIILFIY